MKSFIFFKSKFFSLSLFAVMAGCLPALAQTANITITDKVLEKSYIGNGVQWSGYPTMDISEADWQNTFKRLDFMKLNFIRLIVNADEYCQTFPLGGAPVYHFDTDKLKRVYRILDYCQSRNVSVIFGEWSDPAYNDRSYDFSKKELRHDGIQEYDPRWTYIIADFLSYLINDRKYTCIKYYNLGNEPNGFWMHTESFATWRLSMINLDNALKNKGLRDKIRIVGPDCAWGNDWIKKIIEDKELVNIIDDYEVHSYADKKEIEDAKYEKEMRLWRNYITDHDPNGAKKHFFMGEAGMVYGKNDKDQQTYIATFQYGVWMSDFVIQSMRAGQAGLIAWDLDDAMHTTGAKKGTTVNDFEWKEWGMWDSFGAEKGHPEKEAPRPWYYTWSLLCKYIPQGAEVLKTTESDSTLSVRSAAAQFTSNNKKYFTVAIVSNEDHPVEVKITMPSSSGKANWKQYNYFEGNMPKDKEGFPAPAKILKNKDLKDSLTISMPGKGVVILTTAD